MDEEEAKTTGEHLVMMIKAMAVKGKGDGAGDDELEMASSHVVASAR